MRWEGKKDLGNLIVHGGASSFLTSDQWQGALSTVKVRSIDSLIAAGLPVPDLLKADIQGYELEMLRGAEESLQKVKFIQLELSWIPLYEKSPIAADVIQYLGAKNFHVFDICTYSMRPFDQRLTQSDVIFANAELGYFNDSRWS